MIDSVNLLMTLVEMGHDADDHRAAIGMMFKFDEVFNQKTQELLQYGLGLDKVKQKKVTAQYLQDAYVKRSCLPTERDLQL